MAIARGKYAKAISDRSGMEFPYSEMVKEWNGMLVHKSEFEPKHPQIQPKPHGGDAQALLNHAPGHGLTNGTTYRFRGAPKLAGTYANPASFDGIAGSNIAKAAGYAITTGKFVDDSRVTTNTSDNFYFTVDTSTATAGGVKGGGFPVSVGPVTLSA
jgi:hypothetical protein